MIGEALTVRRAFESMPLIMIEYAGSDHRVAAINAAFRRIVGREHEQLIGVPVREAMPELAGQQVFEMFDEVYATGREQVAREWRMQVSSGPGGDLREIYLDFHLVPARDEHGAVAGMRAFATDVTDRVLERQAAQVRTAAAEQRYEQARDVITSLQRQLLPPGLPVLPAARIASSYLLADTETAAGGDWFDAVPLPDGRVALVVGDVVGHGIAASAAMGQLRAVLQDRLDNSGDILTAVRAADRMARRTPAAHAATLCIVVLNLADGALTWCSAGHPPPLVVNADTARFLPSSGNAPLGTGAEYTVATDRLAAAEMVLLYSDGIIERPGREPAAATVELSQVAVDAVAGRGMDTGDLSAVERACTQTLELLVRRTGHIDDITLLAAQRRTPPPAVQLNGPAAAVTPRIARNAVTDWLTSLEAGEEDLVALTHAVVELVTNAAEHARPDAGDATVTVTADLRNDGEAQLRVADNGRWRHRTRPGDEQFRADHGFGLAMTASFAHHLDIDRSPQGTTVTVRRRLSHPARLLTAAQISHGRPGDDDKPAEVMIILEQPHAASSRIAVHGPLDVDSVEELGTELDRFTLGGTHELTVDLTAVTHLSSAAIAELYRPQRYGDGRPYPLRLYAPAGSTAHHVLSLVNLPHTTTDPDTAGDHLDRAG
ncbi:SpoIIE family protein phosphatase [Actinoplanes sp. Pm04-4]|uniref:SpoIIE family protein phosphatase n=1 Tax=Paractinoplanes pyxinae TaxID=2997416 RepID=A0ABT4B544_9ACTN|nr:SpoIIE family protein phosphatase [Actinoplanes pyxinae]MCY1141614.1 SpoIIE family protein phosphatase [Actinoplanes pyxinae]